MNLPLRKIVSRLSHPLSSKLSRERCIASFKGPHADFRSSAAGAVPGRKILEWCEKHGFGKVEAFHPDRPHPLIDDPTRTNHAFWQKHVRIFGTALTGLHRFLWHRGFAVEGVEELRAQLDPRRPIIFCSGHQGEMEPFLVGNAVANALKISPYFAITEDSWTSPFLPAKIKKKYNYLFQYFGGLRFDRRRLSADDVNRSVAVLRGERPWNVEVVYPEAVVPALVRFPTNRSTFDKSNPRGRLRSSLNPETGLLDPKALAAILQLLTNAQIVAMNTDSGELRVPPEHMPDRIRACQDAWVNFSPLGEGDLLFWAKKARVRFGKVFKLEEQYGGKPLHEITFDNAMTWMSDVLMPAIGQLHDGNTRIVPWRPGVRYKRINGMSNHLPLTDDYFKRARRMELLIAMSYRLVGDETLLKGVPIEHRPKGPDAFARFAYDRKDLVEERGELETWAGVDHQFGVALRDLNKRNLDERWRQIADQIHPREPSEL